VEDSAYHTNHTHTGSCPLANALGKRIISTVHKKEAMNCKEEAIEEDPADSPGSGAIVPVSSASFIRVRNASI
jgi:hypothetical protein